VAFAVTVLIGLVMAFVIFKVGYAMLASFSSPMPEPPPPGELRKVKLRFKCPQCGMELRVTQAPDEVVLPPRHCMDEMDLVPDPDDL
jgi:hypothetical protein